MIMKLSDLKNHDVIVAERRQGADPEYAAEADHLGLACNAVSRAGRPLSRRA